jgi:hypothetical protein
MVETALLDKYLNEGKLLYLEVSNTWNTFLVSSRYSCKVRP